MLPPAVASVHRTSSANSTEPAAPVRRRASPPRPPVLAPAGRGRRAGLTAEEDACAPRHAKTPQLQRATGFVRRPTRSAARARTDRVSASRTTCRHAKPSRRRPAPAFVRCPTRCVLQPRTDRVSARRARGVVGMTPIVTTGIPAMGTKRATAATVASCATGRVVRSPGIASPDTRSWTVQRATIGTRAHSPTAACPGRASAAIRRCAHRRTSVISPAVVIGKPARVPTRWRPTVRRVTTRTPARSMTRVARARARATCGTATTAARAHETNATPR